MMTTRCLVKCICNKKETESLRLWCLCSSVFHREYTLKCWNKKKGVSFLIHVKKKQ